LITFIQKNVEIEVAILLGEVDEKHINEICNYSYPKYLWQRSHPRPQTPLYIYKP
jgi:hypothetical protein